MYPGQHICRFILCLFLISRPPFLLVSVKILAYLQMTNGKTVVDKKQKEFSIKKMIKRLHIKEPVEHVMAILGKK